MVVAKSITIGRVDAKFAAIFSANVVVADVVAGKVAVELPSDVTRSVLEVRMPVDRWFPTSTVAVATENVATSNTTAGSTPLSVIARISTVEDISNKGR